MTDYVIFKYATSFNERLIPVLFRKGFCIWLFFDVDISLKGIFWLIATSGLLKGWALCFEATLLLLTFPNNSSSTESWSIPQDPSVKMEDNIKLMIVKIPDRKIFYTYYWMVGNSSIYLSYLLFSLEIFHSLFPYLTACS